MPTLAAQWAESEGPVARLYLVEVDEFLGPDDPRFAQLEDRIGTALKRRVMLGSYARPLGADELAPPAAGARRRAHAQTPAADTLAE